MVRLNEHVSISRVPLSCRRVSMRPRMCRLRAGVSVMTEDRAEFEELLEMALAIDPDTDTSNRLLNLISQKRARNLLDHADDFFFEPIAEKEENVR